MRASRACSQAPARDDHRDHLRCTVNDHHDGTAWCVDHHVWIDALTMKELA